MYAQNEPLAKLDVWNGMRLGRTRYDGYTVVDRLAVWQYGTLAPTLPTLSNYGYRKQGEPDEERESARESVGETRSK